MARHRSRRHGSRRHGSRRHRTRRHRMSGGSNYTDGASYGVYVNGNGDAQFNRTFDQSGPYGNRVGAEYIGAQGQGVQQAGVPTSQNLALIQSAGGRGKKGKKGKKGGFLGEMVNQAAVPLLILGAQQSYGRKRSSRRH